MNGSLCPIRESVVIVEGSHDQVRLARMVAMATGAFANSHAVEIISSNELTTLAQNGGYRPRLRRAEYGSD